MSVFSWQVAIFLSIVVLFLSLWTAVADALIGKLLERLFRRFLEEGSKEGFRLACRCSFQSLRWELHLSDLKIGLEKLFRMEEPLRGSVFVRKAMVKIQVGFVDRWSPLEGLKIVRLSMEFQGVRVNLETSTFPEGGPETLEALRKREFRLVDAELLMGRGRKGYWHSFKQILFRSAPKIGPRSKISLFCEEASLCYWHRKAASRDQSLEADSKVIFHVGRIKCSNSALSLPNQLPKLDLNENIFVQILQFSLETSQLGTDIYARPIRKVDITVLIKKNSKKRFCTHSRGCDVTLEASTSPLVLHLDPIALSSTGQIICDFVESMRLWKVRHFRPSETVHRRPDLWWKYAIQAVLQRIRKGGRDVYISGTLSPSEKVIAIANYREFFKSYVLCKLFPCTFISQKLIVENLDLFEGRFPQECIFVAKCRAIVELWNTTFGYFCLNFLGNLKQSLMQHTSLHDIVRECKTAAGGQWLTMFPPVSFHLDLPSATLLLERIHGGANIEQDSCRFELLQINVEWKRMCIGKTQCSLSCKDMCIKTKTAGEPMHHLLQVPHKGEHGNSPFFSASFTFENNQACMSRSSLSFAVPCVSLNLMLTESVLHGMLQVFAMVDNVLAAFSLPRTYAPEASNHDLFIEFTCDGGFQVMLQASSESCPSWLVFESECLRLSCKKSAYLSAGTSKRKKEAEEVFLPALGCFPSTLITRPSCSYSSFVFGCLLGIAHVWDDAEEGRSRDVLLEQSQIQAGYFFKAKQLDAGAVEDQCSGGMLSKFFFLEDDGVQEGANAFETSYHFRICEVQLNIRPSLLEAIHRSASFILKIMNARTHAGNNSSLSARVEENGGHLSCSFSLDMRSVAICLANFHGTDLCSFRMVGIRLWHQTQGFQVHSGAEAAEVFVEGVPGASNCLLRPNFGLPKTCQRRQSLNTSIARNGQMTPSLESQSFLRISVSSSGRFLKTEVVVGDVWLLADPRFLEILLDGCFLYLELCADLIARLQAAAQFQAMEGRTYPSPVSEGTSALLSFRLSSLEIPLLESALGSPSQSHCAKVCTLHSTGLGWTLSREGDILETSSKIESIMLCIDGENTLISMDTISGSTPGSMQYAAKSCIVLYSDKTASGGGSGNFKWICRSVKIHVGGFHVLYDVAGLQQMLDIFYLLSVSMGSSAARVDLHSYRTREGFIDFQQQVEASLCVEGAMLTIPRERNDCKAAIILNVEGIKGTCAGKVSILALEMAKVSASCRTVDSAEVFFEAPTALVEANLETKIVTVALGKATFSLNNSWFRTLVWSIFSNWPTAHERSEGSQNSAVNCDCSDALVLGGCDGHATSTSQATYAECWSINFTLAEVDANITAMNDERIVSESCQTSYRIFLQHIEIIMELKSTEFICKVEFECLKLWHTSGCKQAVSPPLLDCPGLPGSHFAKPMQHTEEVAKSKFQYTLSTHGSQVIHFVLSNSCTFRLTAQELASLDPLWNLVRVFTQFDIPKGSFRRERKGYESWIHLNVVLENCSVVLLPPKQHCVPGQQVSLLLHGQQLYVNYSWDRGSHSITKVILSNLEALIQRGSSISSSPWDPGVLSCILPFTILFERVWTIDRALQEQKIMDNFKIDAAEAIIWPEALFLLQPLLGALIDKWFPSSSNPEGAAMKGGDTTQSNTLLASTPQYTMSYSLHAGIIRLVDSVPAGRPLAELSVDELQGDLLTALGSDNLDARLELRAGGRMFDDLGDTQPFMDPWSICLRRKCSLTGIHYHIRSEERLNVLLSPRLLQLFGSMELFIKGWNGLHPVHVDTASINLLQDVEDVEHLGSEQRLASKDQRPWVIINDTGLNLWFWNDSLGKKTKTYAVAPGEGQPIPWTRRGSSSARPPLLSVQLDGGWAPIRDLQFTATGQHAAILARSLVGHAPVTLVADMLGGRRLRLRSPLRVRNCTCKTISMRLQSVGEGSVPEEMTGGDSVPTGVLAPGAVSSIALSALSVKTVIFMTVRSSDCSSKDMWIANDGLWLNNLRGDLVALKGLLACSSTQSDSSDVFYLSINAIESHRVPWMKDYSHFAVGEDEREDYACLYEIQILPPLVMESRLPTGYVLRCSLNSDEMAHRKHGGNPNPAVESHGDHAESGRRSLEGSGRISSITPRTFMRIGSKSIMEDELETLTVDSTHEHQEGVVSGQHIYRFDVKRHTIRLLMTLTVPQHLGGRQEESGSTLSFQMSRPVRVVAPKARRSLRRAVPKRRKVELVLNRGTSALETTRRWTVLAIDVEQVIPSVLSYRVAVSAPYLLANHTPIPVSFRTYKAAVKGHSSIVTVPAAEERQDAGWVSPVPALFYSKDKRVLLKVGNSKWSEPFEIDKVGLDCVLRLRDRDKPKQAYDIGLGISWIKSNDGRRISRLIMVSPAVILKNCTGKTLSVAGGLGGFITLQDNEVVPLITMSPEGQSPVVPIPREETEGDIMSGHRYLRVKPHSNPSEGMLWLWSEPFRINTPGEQTLRLCAAHSEDVEDAGLLDAAGGKPLTSSHALLDVHVQFVSASLIVTLGPFGNNAISPYRIANACSKIRLKCYQKGISNRPFYVEPLSSVEYAWDAPLRSRRLKVVLEPLDCLQTVVREYNLDEIAARPSIIVKLKQSPQDMDVKETSSNLRSNRSHHLSRVASMSGTVGEKQSIHSGLRQRVKRGLSEPDNIFASQEMEDGRKDVDLVSERLWVASTARTEVLTVRVVAAGATRVLEVSDIAGSLCEEENEEARLLTAKLEKLQKRIYQVDLALQKCNSQSEALSAAGQDSSTGKKMDSESLTPGGILLKSTAERFPKAVSFSRAISNTREAPENLGLAKEIASLIPGGELRVLVCAVDGFREGSPITKSDESLRYVTTLSRLRPFVRVFCGRQQRQTWVHRTGQNRPSGWAWDEELVFHGVPASDTIRVEVLHYSRWGDHGLLGEALVDLAPYFVEETTDDTKDQEKGFETDVSSRRARWFPLTSRGTSKHSLHHGRVGLALIWNRSLLEQLTLGLKAKESELRVKESILSELTGSKKTPQDFQAALSSLASSNELHDVSGSEASSSWKPRSKEVHEPYPKSGRPTKSFKGARMDSKVAFDKYEKVLVRVIEARGLKPPGASFTPARSLCDTYVRISTKGSGFHAPIRTRTVYSTNDPAWNENFCLRKMHHNAIIKCDVYKRNRLRKDTRLGTAVIDLAKLEPKIPHYLRLQLKSKKVSSFSQNDSVPSWLGELRIRIECVLAAAVSFNSSMRQLSQVSDLQDEEEASFRLSIELAGIGLSLAEGAIHPGLSWSSGEELLHLYIGGCDFQLARVSGDDKVRLTVGYLQLDNQLLTAQEPVILYASPSVDQMDARPVLELSFVKSDSYESVVHFRYLSFLVQELDIHLEEPWLDRVSSFVLETILLWRSRSQVEEEEPDIDDTTGAALTTRRYLQVSMIKLALEFARTSPPPESKGRKLWYVELLHLHPIKVNVTVCTSHGIEIPNVADGTDSGQGKTEAGFSALTGFPILSISNAPVRLDALLVEHVFEQKTDLLAKLHTHYRRQILVEIYKIIGSAAALGSPVAALADVGTGVTSLFYEPARGLAQSPKDFGAGLGRGVKHLVLHSVAGIMGFVSTGTGSAASGLESLTGDDKLRWTAERKIARHGLQRRTRRRSIGDAFRDIGVGVRFGLSGALRRPVEGFRTEGVLGLLTGTGRGALGVLALPAAGAARFLSKAAGGLGEIAAPEEFRKPKVRVRAPRMVEMEAAKTTALLLHRLHDAFGMLGIESLQADIPQAAHLIDNKIYVLTNKHVVCLVAAEEGQHIQLVRLRWSLQLGQIVSVTPSSEYVKINYSKMLQDCGHRLESSPGVGGMALHKSSSDDDSEHEEAAGWERKLHTKERRIWCPFLDLRDAICQEIMGQVASICDANVLKSDGQGDPLPSPGSEPSPTSGSLSPEQDEPGSPEDNRSNDMPEVLSAPSCDVENTEDLFCISCGSALKRPGASYCSKCGASQACSSSH